MLRNPEVVVAELGEPHRLLEERARRRQPEVLLRLERFSHERASLGGPRQPRRRGRVAHEDGEAERVEGRHRKGRVAALQARGDPLAQIGGRLAREGEDEQLVRPRMLLVDQTNGALDDDPRLPRARPGEDEGRPLAVRDGGRLVLV